MQKLELNRDDSLKIKPWSRAKKCTSQIFSPNRSTRLSLASNQDKEARGSTKDLEKFNEKVKKRNSKFSKRRKSRSSTRKDKKMSKNSTMSKLEGRLPKGASQSQIKLDNQRSETADRKNNTGKQSFNHDKRRLSNKSRKFVTSAQQTQSDLATSSHYERASELNKLQDCDDMCNILDLPNSNQGVSKSPNKKERDASFDRDIANPSYDPSHDTSQFRTSTRILGRKLKKSKFKSKRNSRSKNQRNSTEERKESKNSSNDSRRYFKPILKPKKAKIMRPFSGGIQKPDLKSKPSFKLAKQKQRPQTAKQQEPDLKSPYRKKLLSPTSSKKVFKNIKKKSSKLAKNGTKKTTTSSRNNRKASLSPSTDRGDRNIYTMQGGNHGKNDYLLRMDPEVPTDVLHNQYFQENKEAKITIIQKFMRGFKEYQTIQKIKEEAKLQTKNASNNISDTFERATGHHGNLRILDSNNRANEHQDKVANSITPNSRESAQQETKTLKKKPLRVAIDSKHNKSFENSGKKDMKNITKKLMLSIKKRPKTANSHKTKKIQEISKQLGERIQHSVFTKCLKTGTKKPSQVKPPTGKRKMQGLRDKTPVSKSSFSEILTTCSPLNAIEGFEKYQMLIKKQIKEDYKSNLKKIQQRVEKNKRKYDKRYKHNQINEICYMAKMQEIQEWQDKAQKEIQIKKKHHLNI